MQQRVKFESDSIRESFFNAVKAKGNFESWAELYKYFSKRGTLIQKYRFGQLLLPLDFYEQLQNILPAETRTFFKSKIIFLDGNWGRVKGGEITRAKYPKIFKIGRKIAHSTQEYSLGKGIELNKELCEFIGALIGDGFIGKYGRTHIVELIGNNTLDNQYLHYHKHNIEKMFEGVKGNLYELPTRHSLRVRFYSKQFYEFLIREFDFPTGVKCYSIKIPEIIITSDEKLIFATIRGIFDTDGCVFFDRRKAYKKSYPRVTMCTASQSLFFQLKEFLSRYFSLYAVPKSSELFSVKYEITIYGKKQLEKWMSLIGFSNERHLSKIRSLR